MLAEGSARRALVVALMVPLALSACGGNASQPIGTASSTATASPTSVAATVTPPTVAPATVAPPTFQPTAQPEGKLEKVRLFLKAWKSYAGSAYVNYQVIVELRNTGTGWAKVSGFDSDYTILDTNGDVTATGSFSYEFPEFIPAGGTGYLVEDSSKSGVKVSAFATVEVDGRYDAVDEPGVLITVSGIKLRNEAYSGGLSATGFLTAAEDVSDAAVAVICLNSKGEPIGATWTNLIQNLSANKKKGFETVGETPPLRISDCKTVVGFAQSTGF